METMVGSGRPTAYRSRVLSEVAQLCASLGVARNALDFGAGDGWYTVGLRRLRIAEEVVAVDVKPRGEQLIPVRIYDGRRLPFRDREFALSVAIDVLHHCPAPEAAAAELLRCTNEYFVLKDHTYSTTFQRVVLGVLDELGNRRFGVPSPQHYQRDWTWNRCIETSGFERVRLVYPAQCHTGLLGRATNHLQFLALWRRRR
jgi:SAM-dependent methyltransferase